MGCDRATLNYQVERYVPTDIFFAPGNINLAIMARLIFWSGFGRFDYGAIWGWMLCVGGEMLKNPRISGA